MSPDSEKIILRRALLADSDFLFSLRNDPVVIATSSSGTGVRIDEHVEWLTRVLKSDVHLLSIIESRHSAERIGFSRLDKRDQSDAVISVAIVTSWRNRSLGSASIEDTARLGFEHWEGLRRILAYVKIENKASETAFERGGFQREEFCDLEGHHLFSLERSGFEIT